MKHLLSVVLLLAVVALVAGCAQYSNQQAPPAVPAAQPAQPSQPAAQPSTAPTPPAQSGNVAASATVTIQGFKFNPDTVTIPVGGTVTWTNADSATHTVKAADFISDNIPTGATYSHTFTTKGTFQYNCGIHPSMQGTVVVE